jgi:quinol monooxygenase YgiN
MHIITVDFVANTEDAEAVRAAYQPVIDAYAKHESCLGSQLLQNKSRKNRTRFKFVNYWRSREEAMEISALPEVHTAHDLIEVVQTGEQSLQAWEPVVIRGAAMPAEAGAASA